MQRAFYRFCKKRPSEYWNYSPLETSMMIEEAVSEEDEQFTIEAIRHAQTLCVVINMHKSEKEPVARVEDFLPKTVVTKLFPQVSIEDKRNAQIEKARSLAKRCEEAGRRVRK